MSENTITGISESCYFVEFEQNSSKTIYFWSTIPLMIFNKHSHTHTYIWCFGTSVSFPVAIISRIACCLHLINSVGQRVSEEKKAAQLPATAFCNTLRSSSFCLLHREAIPFLQKPFARNSTAFSDTYGSKDNRDIHTKSEITPESQITHSRQSHCQR